MLCENGRPIQSLQYDCPANARNKDRYFIKSLLQRGAIDSLRVTEAEIEDRSKGDFISKFVVVLQTT